MAEESRMLAEVKVYPYSTEEDCRAFGYDIIENEAAVKSLRKELKQSN
jgi:hypothetical protein